MHTFKHLRRAVVLAAGIAATGALVAFGTSASASAQTYTQIYGSGAAIQNQLWNDILSPDSEISPTPIFTQTTAGDGFKEFGNENGKLDPTQDKTANPQLDAFVVTDSPPTGPLDQGPSSPSNLYNANAASGTNEITVPVAQVPLDVLLSLPVGLTVTGNVDLTNELVSQLYAGTVPSDGGYSGNTWGALLTEASADFTPNGEGDTPIKVEVRKNGAGATLNLKYYLFDIDENYLKEGPWKEPAVLNDANSYGEKEWPNEGANIANPSESENNSTDEAEVLKVWDTPGTVGYGTAGDAATQGFENTEVTGGDSQEVLYAQVQDNGVEGDPEGDDPDGTPIYADPEVSDGVGNLYTGDVKIVGEHSGDVGSWTVPGSPNGSWAPTEGSDPNVFGDAGGVSPTDNYYPLESVLYALSWEEFSILNSDYDGDAADAGYTTQQLLEFSTGTSSPNVGQNDIGNSGTDPYYYAPLPENIVGYAQDAAAEIHY